MLKYFKSILYVILIVSMVICFIPTVSFAASDEVSDVKYEMDSDEALDFIKGDFNDECEDLTGEELDYVKFTLPDDDDGILYYDYDEDDSNDNTEVSSSQKYYYSKSPYLSKVVFVPDENFSDTVTIKYKGCDVDGNSYTGKIKITVRESSDIISYSIRKSNDAVDFEEDDFDDACDDIQDEDLDYVKFSLPDDDDGTLYYNYDEDDDTHTKVTTSKKYYYEDKSPYLSKVSFVPDKDFSGTVTIKYKGYDVDGDSYSGKVKITVGDDDDDDEVIEYSTDEDESVKLDDDDFFDVCDEIQDEELDYIKFVLPDSDDGILYYDYDEDDTNTKVTASQKYYYEDKSPYLSKVYFVPDKDFSGAVTIKYKGYDVDGDSYSGKIKITVGDDDSSGEIVEYQIKDNDEMVVFDEDDFNDVSNEKNDENLDYIKITIPSASKGILYYNYDDGEYSSIVSSGKKYYYDSSPYISKITFVPDEDFTGTLTIKYTGYDVDGDSFSGTINIASGSGSTAADVVSYSSNINTTTVFKDEDFNKVCKSMMDNQLSYVKFTLPSSSYGTLYYGYSTSGNYTSKVSSSSKYYYGGSPYLLNVTFVPADNYTGTVTIVYTGYDIEGQSYSGKVQIAVASGGSSTPIDTSTLISSKYFSDVDISYSWAVPYIDGLYESNIISGTTSGTGAKLYSPASYVTRGDFIYLLYKTLNFKTSSTITNFYDVPSGSYYYTAITTAKALGIVQGSDNKFYPNDPITREDAMVMVLRTVNITGSTISSGDTSSLSKFSDDASISDYSRSAVAALIKAGIITGSDDNHIYPKGNLTRAQIAAIIYRVRDL